MFHFQASHSTICHAKIAHGLPFYSTLLLSDRTDGRLSEQVVLSFDFLCLSVSSFVKKTTEKINTMQMNSELRQRPEFREGGQADATAPNSEETDSE